MSSFLCFLCHSTVNSDTNEDTREKYREVVGMNLCPDSHLCHICCHVLNKLWLFKTVCLKRSLEYPVLFSEKGTINLQRNDLEIHTVCPEFHCGPYHNRNINSKFYHFQYSSNYDLNLEYNNEYVELEDEQTDFGNYFNIHVNVGKKICDQKDVITDCKSIQTESEIIYKYREVQTQTDFDNDLDSNNDLNNSDNDIPADDFTETTNVNDDVVELEDDYRVENNEEIIQEDDNTKEEVEALEKQDFKEETEVKVKKRSKKKKEFEKIILTVKEQKEELEMKRKSAKYLEAVYKCYHCALGFLFKDTYQAHMMRHEESNGEYYCAICTLRFASPCVLRAHAALHRARHRCGRCGDTLRRRAGHACGAARARCPLCGRGLRDKSGLQQHLKRFHQSKNSLKTYSCNVCGKQYNNQAAVRTHMIKHINRTFQCDVCPSRFSTPYTLNRHKLKHSTPTRHYYCDRCNVGFSSEKSLKAHLKNARAHQETNFECPICSRTCPTERSLTQHIESTHSVKAMLCPHCPARYGTRKSLVRHMKRHMGFVEEARPAVCHLCGGTFKGNNKLNRHLREVCEKAKLDEEYSLNYEQHCLNPR